MSDPIGMKPNKIEDLVRLFDFARALTNGGTVDVFKIGDDTIGEYRVSTVKLPFDHGYDGQSRWFETMIFPVGSWSDLYCDRYETEEQATAGHADVVRRVLAGELPGPA